MKPTKICLKIEKCEICGKNIDDAVQLQKHITVMHRDVITAEEYYKKFLKQLPNKCPVCGEETDFRSFIYGYKTLCNKRSCNVAYTNPMIISSYMYHGCTEEEARRKVSEYQRSNAKKVNRTDEYYDKCFSNRIGHWTSKGYTEEEAKEKVSERQNTCSLSAFQKVYGKDDGKIAYEKRLERYIKTWNSHTDEEKCAINKTRGRTYSELVKKFGKKKADEIISKRMPLNCISSKLEKEIVSELKKVFPIVESQLRIKNDLGKSYYYDCVIDGVIIEVNGDYWHANPNFYKSDECVRGMTAKEIWHNDLLKKQTAEKSGYMVFYVWENDYLHNKIETLNTLKRKIYAFKNN